MAYSKKYLFTQIFDNGWAITGISYCWSEIKQEKLKTINLQVTVNEF